MKPKRAFKIIVTGVAILLATAVNCRSLTKSGEYGALWSIAKAEEHEIRRGHLPGITREEMSLESDSPDEQPPLTNENDEVDVGEEGQGTEYEVPSELIVGTEQIGYLNEAPSKNIARKHFNGYQDDKPKYDGHYNRGDRLKVLAYYQWRLANGKISESLQPYFEVRLGSGRVQFVFRNDWELLEYLPEEEPSTEPTEQESDEPAIERSTVDTTGEPSFDLKSNKAGYSPVPVSRKLIKTKRGGANSYCGSYHYYAKSNHRGVKGKRTDWNANFKTNNTCAFMLMAEKWNATVCPGEIGQKSPGCRLSFGDASRVRGGYLKGHATHNRGRTVDVRIPMKASIPFKERNFTFRDRSYSREMTQKMVDMFKEYGAKVVLFNDKNVEGALYWKGHANHLHVKYDEAKAKKVCSEKKMSPEQIKWRKKCPPLDP